MKNVIELTNLTKYYGKVRGIEQVNLTVEQGDIFGFIGPNGAGKSTTIRTILGLISPSSGQALVFGKLIGAHQVEILKQIGYMPSEASFWNGMRVGDVLKFSANLRKQDCTAEAKRLCHALQLDEKRKVDDLSLGNRKKVSIVCALQHKPQLYILDEPTSGLDPLMQKTFFDLLSERRKEGATVFLSSHVLPEVANYCEHAAIIRDGRILRCAPVSELAKTNARRVTLRGVSQPPALQGLKDLQQGENTVSFLYTGSVTVLLAALQGVPLTDITITEPTLQEIFMHYYEEGKDA